LEKLRREEELVEEEGLSLEKKDRIPATFEREAIISSKPIRQSGRKRKKKDLGPKRGEGRGQLKEEKEGRVEEGEEEGRPAKASGEIKKGAREKGLVLEKKGHQCRKEKGQSGRLFREREHKVRGEGKSRNQSLSRGCLRGSLKTEGREVSL